MRKMKYIISAVVIWTTIFLTSCDLDKDPYNVLPEKDAWQEYQDAEFFRKGAYTSFRTIQGGNFVYGWDVQSDLFNATIGYGNRGGMMHSWQFNNSESYLVDFWNYHYANIKDCNYVLDNIDKLIPIINNNDQDNDTKKKEKLAALDLIKGEMHLMRAITYHALVLKFAKDYEPSSASTDLGLPLVKTYNIDDRPARSTVAETYKFINDEVALAKKTLTTKGAANSGYLTVDVIDAFEARVNLYMHNYDDAITLADNIIKSYPLVASKDDLVTMWKNDKASEIVYQPIRVKAERGGSLGAYLSYDPGSSSFKPDFVPSQWVLDLYDADDIRFSVYYLQDRLSSRDELVEDVYMLYKYPGNPTLIDDNTQFYNMFKAFRAAEAYLIAAEASYLNKDETGARKYLNDLRIARKAKAYTEVLKGEELFAQIKNEWIREFVGEGKRMDDLKRWHEGFERHDTQNPRIIANTSDKDLIIDADNMRYVWEIPSNDLSANPNLKPNWK